jgi:hypothetical protein
VKSILRRRPSPALVIACIALFLSLGGVSYGVATGFIDSREIKNNSITSADVRNNTLRTFDIRNNEVRGFDIRNSTIQGRDVAFNTLGGADINEASLGKVPSATAADSATTAATVGGLRVQKFFVKPASGAAAAEIFRGDGFAIEAGCPGGAPVLRVDGIAGAPATNLTVSGTGTGEVAIFTTDTTLVPGDDVSLLGGLAEAAGTATVSTTGGAVATIAYGAESADAFAGETVCAIRGTVTSG